MKTRDTMSMPHKSFHDYIRSRWDSCPYQITSYLWVLKKSSISHTSCTLPIQDRVLLIWSHPPTYTNSSKNVLAKWYVRWPSIKPAAFLFWLISNQKSRNCFLQENDIKTLEHPACMWGFQYEFFSKVMRGEGKHFPKPTVRAVTLIHS